MSIQASERLARARPSARRGPTSPDEGPATRTLEEGGVSVEAVAPIPPGTYTILSQRLQFPAGGFRDLIAFNRRFR